MTKRGTSYRQQLVQLETAYVLDATGWHLAVVPPRWSLDILEPELADEPMDAA